MENECSKQQSKWRWKMIYTFPYYRRNSITLCRSRIVKVAFLIFITFFNQSFKLFLFIISCSINFFLLFIAFARAIFFLIAEKTIKNTKKKPSWSQCGNWVTLGVKCVWICGLPVMRKKSLGDEFELLDINGSVLMRGCSVFTLFLRCM